MFFCLRKSQLHFLVNHLTSREIFIIMIFLFVRWENRDRYNLSRFIFYFIFSTFSKVSSSNLQRYNIPCCFTPCIAWQKETDSLPPCWKISVVILGIRSSEPAESFSFLFFSLSSTWKEILFFLSIYSLSMMNSQSTDCSLY